VLRKAPEFAKDLGIAAGLDFDIEQLRRSIRVDARGRAVPQIFAAITQTRELEVEGTKVAFRGGSTLVVDLTAPRIAYKIVKNIDAENRLERTAQFVRAMRQDPLQRALFASGRQEPFAALHSLAGLIG
jgi:hypothetical protein